MKHGESGGVYVHFPYCVHRCFYCDFNLITPKLIPFDAYTNAILQELEQRAGRLDQPAQSLYFGGGTPSLWKTEFFSRVIDAVKTAPGLLPHAEITLEANPSDVTLERCERWIDAGINRLSLGVQSFNTKTLRAADRLHSGEESHAAIAVAKKAGYDNLSIDLMFGLPGQREEDWAEELKTALELKVPHLSVYGLTVEESTPLHGMIQRREILLPDDSTTCRMFFQARDFLQSHGYSHYEVSAYAMPGHHAVHNSGYWAWRPYLGLGAGAHGFDGKVRWENIRRVKTYIETSNAGKDPTAHQEEIPADTRAFERLMVGLRRLDQGIALDGDCARFRTKSVELIERGWLEWDEDRVRVTREGLGWMNDMLAEFLD